MKNDCFGINIKRYCGDYESTVRGAIADGRITEVLIAQHLEMLGRIQHERLAHLIVTAMCIVCELFVIWLALLHPELGVLPPVIMLALAILLLIYFWHYFFLENTVQRWYVIADEMRKRLQDGEFETCASQDR